MYVAERGERKGDTTKKEEMGRVVNFGKKEKNEKKGLMYKRRVYVKEGGRSCAKKGGGKEGTKLALVAQGRKKENMEGI